MRWRELQVRLRYVPNDCQPGLSLSVAFSHRFFRAGHDLAVGPPGH